MLDEIQLVDFSLTFWFDEPSNTLGGACTFDVGIEDVEGEVDCPTLGDATLLEGDEVTLIDDVEFSLALVLSWPMIYCACGAGV